MTTTTHEYTNTTTKRSSLQQTDGVRAHQYQRGENSKKLVFFLLRRWTATLCIAPIFFCSIEAIIIVSSLRRRPVSYDQGRVSKHISDVKIYSLRSFTLLQLRFPFFPRSLCPSLSFLFALAIILSFNGWPFFPASYSLYVASARKVSLVPRYAFPLSPLELLCFNFNRKTVLRKKNRNRNNRWSKFFFIFFK